MCSTVSSQGAARRPATTKRAPCRARARAVARPMPDPPPVTMEVFPSNRAFLMLVAVANSACDQADPDPAVVATFAVDLQDAHRSRLRCRRQVSAPAGLAVETDALDHADAAIRLRRRR